MTVRPCRVTDGGVGADGRRLDGASGRQRRRGRRDHRLLRARACPSTTTAAAGVVDSVRRTPAFCVGAPAAASHLPEVSAPPELRTTTPGLGSLDLSLDLSLDRAGSGSDVFSSDPDPCSTDPSPVDGVDPSDDTIPESVFESGPPRAGLSTLDDVRRRLRRWVGGRDARMGHRGRPDAQDHCKCPHTCDAPRVAHRPCPLPLPLLTSSAEDDLPADAPGESGISL